MLIGLQTLRVWPQAALYRTYRRPSPKGQPSAPGSAWLQNRARVHLAPAFSGTKQPSRNPGYQFEVTLGPPVRGKRGNATPGLLLELESHIETGIYSHMQRLLCCLSKQ